MDIVFVILHYIAQEETENSVKFIEENVDTPNYHIVIVDNASPNKSGEILKKIYAENTKITVILNSQNLGFARGNNIGFQYAKKNLSPKYLVIMNNDVYLLEKNLKEKLDNEFKRSEFFVLGPMILTRDGRCDSNPSNPFFKNVEEIDIQIKAFQKKLKEYKSKRAMLFAKVVSLYNTCVRRFKPIRKERKDFIYRTEDVKLHGCFLVFSYKYLNEFEGLDESTFLYCEEEFLYKHMLENKKVMVYVPDIVVYHKEDAATDMIYNNSKKKGEFFCINNIDSLRKLRDLYLYYDSINRGEKR